MPSNANGGPVSKLVVAIGWVISALPILALLMSAAMKLTKNPAAVAGFAKYGYGEHLLLRLGIIEASCAVIYAIPRTAVLGAILVTGYLGGATATHVRAGEPNFVLPVILGMLAWVGLFLRDRRVRQLLPLRD